MSMLLRSFVYSNFFKNMSIDTLIEICEQLPGATAQIKIEHHLTYNVGGKSFIWLGQDNVPVSCSIKCTEEDFLLLREREGFSPAPYMARNKWILCHDIELLTAHDMAYIRKSYELIRNTLSKKVIEMLK